MRAAGNSVSSVEPGTRSDTIDVPGATTSGPRSALRLEKSATRSSDGSAVVNVSRRAGGDHERIVGRHVERARVAPLLPAAATTTMPSFHSCSTAQASTSER